MAVVLARGVADLTPDGHRLWPSPILGCSQGAALLFVMLTHTWLWYSWELLTEPRITDGPRAKPSGLCLAHAGHQRSEHVTYVYKTGTVTHALFLRCKSPMGGE